MNTGSVHEEKKNTDTRSEKKNNFTKHTTGKTHTYEKHHQGDDSRKIFHFTSTGSLRIHWRSATASLLLSKKRNKERKKM